MLKHLNNYLRGITVLLTLYCGAGIALLSGPPGWFVLVVLLAVAVRKRRRPNLTTLGSARWADEGDVKRAGMLGGETGIILGTLSPKRPRSRLRHEELVQLNQSPHTAIFAPTGAGKGVSLVVPFLMTNPKSCVVTDFKGELYSLTAEHRRRAFGHLTPVLDPFGIVTQRPDTFNPLQFIEANSLLAVDDCNDLANAIIVRSGKETDPHWNDLASVAIAAVTATVVAHGQPGTRNLPTAREILSHPKSFEMAKELMVQSKLWNGALASLGGQLSHLVDREKASVLSSALRHLRFLGTPAIAVSMMESTFDPGLLRSGKMTLYLVLPPDRAHAQSGLLRLWISSMLRACVRGGLQ